MLESKIKLKGKRQVDLIMNRISVEQIKNGHEGNSFKLQIRRKMKQSFPSGAKSIDYELADATGSIKGRKFINKDDEIKSLFDDIKIGDICEITGSYSLKYKSITIDTLKKTQEFNLEEFVKIPKIDDEQLMNEIRSVIEGLENPHLKNLCKYVFQDEEFVKKYKSIPSATKYHHTYPKGNLEHIIGVLRICKTLLNLYDTSQNRYINRDLLLTSVIFHDVGKLFTYELHNGIGKVTELGAKIDHIVLGNNFILKQIENFKDFPESLKIDLTHLLLSHHGRKEWGSPVTPKTPEAEILHLADLLDSRFRKALEGKFTLSSY
ncbi:MAG: HD domain-containing protein [Candidatus Helarchaeota archaeon]|nr:HD domain-containing protein [Candidatus Helarchaeota archaeon]